MPPATQLPVAKPHANLRDLSAQMQLAGVMQQKQDDAVAVALANNPAALETLERVLDSAKSEPELDLDSAYQQHLDAQHDERMHELKQEEQQLQQQHVPAPALEEKPVTNAQPQQPQQQARIDAPSSAHGGKETKYSNSDSDMGVVASYVVGGDNTPNTALVVHDETPFWVYNLDLISPDPDLAWRRRCPPHTYFMDIDFKDLYVHVWKPKTPKAQGQNGGSGAATVNDDGWVTIRSTKQGDRPMRYRTPLGLMGESLLGYGNWKGVPSNQLRKFCPADIKQAKQQVVMKSTAWNKLTATTTGQHSHVMAFFEWRTNKQRWYIEALIEKGLVQKYVDLDILDERSAMRRLLVDQLKAGRISNADANQQLAAWKLTPLDIVQLFMSKHVTQPVKLRNVKVDGAQNNDGTGLSGTKRRRDGSEAEISNNSSSSSGLTSDFDIDGALNTAVAAAAKTGVPHTEYMVLEKKVLRAPSKMKEGDEQSEFERMKARPFKAQTPLLQSIWDKYGLLYDEIKMVQLAKGGGNIAASSIEMVEQAEAQGMNIPSEFKAKRQLQKPMSTSSDSKESNSNSSSNCKIEPGLSGSMQPGSQYKYNNPSKGIDWDKAAVNSGDIWAFEVETGCFTSSPQKTAGIKDKPMIGFFYRKSRVVAKPVPDDTSIEIPGAEEYSDDRRSSMLTDADMLQALANTEAEVQQQRSVQQNGQQYSQQYSAPPPQQQQQQQQQFYQQQRYYQQQLQ